MSELFTYGSVGGAGGNPGSYPEFSFFDPFHGCDKRISHAADLSLIIFT